MALDEKDVERIQAMISDGLAGAGEQFAEQAKSAATEAIDEKLNGVTQTLTNLSKTVEGLAANKPAAPDDGDGETQYVTKAELKALQDKQAEQAQAAEADAKVKAARDAYVANKMAKLPAAYRDRMPVTDDAEKLAAAEKEIREQLKADLTGLGVKAPDLGETPPASGGAADAQLDPSKMTAEQKIKAGLDAKQK